MRELDVEISESERLRLRTIGTVKVEVDGLMIPKSWGR
jgi:hypothetical protein